MFASKKRYASCNKGLQVVLFLSLGNRNLKGLVFSKFFGYNPYVQSVTRCFATMIIKNLKGIDNMLNSLLALITGNCFCNIKSSDDPSRIFAALKLVEKLYKDGKIEKTVFKNVLEQYSDKVDITKFNLD